MFYQSSPVHVLSRASVTCTYPMVSAMTSYSSLTSRRIFVSRKSLAVESCLSMTKVANVPSGEERGETDVFTGYDRSIHEELT